jgi:hypothetical protein
VLRNRGQHLRLSRRKFMAIDLATEPGVAELAYAMSEDEQRCFS